MKWFEHKPVMLRQAVSALKPMPTGRYVDGTLGGGGHAAAILEASSPTGWLSGCDQDGDAVAAAAERLSPYEGRFEIRRDNFRHLDDWIAPASCDGVLLDLGVSSHQLDTPERGFSLMRDGELNMAMDQRAATTAMKLINESPVEDLIRWFRELGDVTGAGRLARAIDAERRRQPIVRTTQLADLVERVQPRRGKRTHPATKVFQALRMVVNDELGALQQGLKAAWSVLKPGGRLAVITFHSLEDRTVKAFAKERSQDYAWDEATQRPDWSRPRPRELKYLNRKAIVPDEQELRDNPRSRSAQLRVFEKLPL